MNAVAAMRRYVHGFVNSHDFEVCRELMSTDYTLYMGPDVVRGRDDHYIPAVRHQMDQFPELGFSLHDLISDGEWTALFFSEHGQSLRVPGTAASWLGIGIYRWDGAHLAECWVEQDHYDRRRQLAGERPVTVPPVAVDPWALAEVAPSLETERCVREWLGSLAQWPPPGMEVHLEAAGDDHQPVLLDLEASLDVVVTCGQRAAFHATLSGRYVGGLPGLDAAPGRVKHYVAAFVTTGADGVRRIDAVTHRVALGWQLLEGRPGN